MPNPSASPEPSEPKITVNDQTRRLEKVDRLLIGHTYEQIGRHIQEPVGNTTERDIFGVTPDKEKEILLRNAQWAYTFVANKCGFDSDGQVDATGRYLNVHDPADFQTFYDQAREWTGDRTEELKAELRAKGEFIPDEDPLTGEQLPKDSLLLLWQLHQQGAGANAITEQQYNATKAKYEHLRKAYGPKLSIETYMNAAKVGLYTTSLEQTMNRAITSIQTRAFYATRSLLSASSTTSFLNRELGSETQGNLERLPEIIDKAIKAIETAGTYVPIRDADTNPPERFGSGSLKRLQLALELAGGKNKQATQKALEEQQEREIQREIKEAYVKNRRESHAANTISSQAIVESTIETTSQPAVGLWERATRIFRNRKRNPQPLPTVTPELPSNLSHQEILAHIGLDPQIVLSLWRQSADKGASANDPSSAEFVRRENIRILQTIEKQRPGIAQTLFKEYGIINYSRYPTEMLIDQYDNRDRHDIPYGIIMNPLADWNGAFVFDKATFHKLYKKTSGNFHTRIVEVDGRMDVAKKLLALRKRYSSDISYAIIGGHGTEHTIDFGPDESTRRKVHTQHQLRMEDLVGHGARIAGDFFAPNATIILNSCSTGDTSRKSIAQKISERTGLTVFAPRSSIHQIDFTINIQPGNISLLPIYDGNSYWTSGFERGKHIDRVKQAA